jgi:hypothetical protein
MTNPLDIPLGALADAASQAAAAADAEARAAGIERAGLLKSPRLAGKPRPTVKGSSRHSGGGLIGGKGDSASGKTSARRKLGG